MSNQNNYQYSADSFEQHHDGMFHPQVAVNDGYGGITNGAMKSGTMLENAEESTGRRSYQLPTPVVETTTYGQDEAMTLNAENSARAEHGDGQATALERQEEKKTLNSAKDTEYEEKMQKAASLTMEMASMKHKIENARVSNAILFNTLFETGAVFDEE